MPKKIKMCTAMNLYRDETDQIVSKKSVKHQICTRIILISIISKGQSKRKKKREREHLSHVRRSKLTIWFVEILLP